VSDRRKRRTIVIASAAQQSDLVAAAGKGAKPLKINGAAAEICTSRRHR